MGHFHFWGGGRRGNLNIIGLKKLAGQSSGESNIQAERRMDRRTLAESSKGGKEATRRKTYISGSFS